MPSAKVNPVENRRAVPRIPCRLKLSVGLIVASIRLVAVAPAAAPQTWSPAPWLADLAQAKQAFKTKYANLDWLEHDRDVTLDGLFARALQRLDTAQSDEEAKTIINRLVERVGDGHVTIEWPRPAAPKSAFVASTLPKTDACVDLGFDENRETIGVGPSLPGYRQVGDPDAFPAGIIHVANRTVGVLRVGGFEPYGDPTICRSAFAALGRPLDQPCDDACQDAVLTWSYDRLTRALEDKVRRLRDKGATALLVDITGNGGGSEWAEAAARILTPKMLTSESRGFVRGPHWAEQWATLAQNLRHAAETAGSDRQRLLEWANEADAARAVADQPCEASRACSIVARTGYATGIVGRANAGAFAGKSWADQVFSIAQFPYHDGVWKGPLMVLVDNETWSAAEEFAAVLQDNRAAIVIGTRTGGAGCGHTNGGTPTRLSNSGGILELPDCVRYRADGSNEVAGIVPDVLTGMKASDARSLKAKFVARHLEEALRRAVQD